MRQQEFIKGMDLSWIPQYEEERRKFYDEAGSEIDPILLAKENEVNLIRLRIWNEPKNIEPMGYCDLAHTIAMAKRIKDANMQFMLDFHYSDTWADPSNQTKPKAWQELGVKELGQAVYDYTYKVLTALKQAGTLPEYIQVGNEIRSGMLFPEGTTEHWDNLAYFVNEGIRAIREFDPQRSMKIIIHLDQGGRFYYLKEWFDSALEHGVTDFDIIGISYYPFWHGGYQEFKDSMENLVERYHRPVIVAETAYAYRITPQSFIGEQQEKISGFPCSPEGQRKVMDLIMNITANVSNGMGAGVCYWEPFAFPDRDGGWGENMGLIDEHGKVLDGIKAYRYQKGDFCNESVARIYEPEMIQCLWKESSKAELQKTLRVLNYEGIIKQIPIEYEGVKRPQKPGIQEVAGIGINTHKDGTIEKIHVVQRIEWVEHLDEARNLIPNGDFEQQFEGWNLTKSEESVTVEVREEFVKPFPEPPVANVYVQSGINFTMDLWQEIGVDENGQYELSIKLRGDNTTGVDVVLYCVDKDKNQEEKNLTIYPQNEQWMEYKIPGIQILDQSVRVGIRISSPPISLKLKEFVLRQREK